MRTIKFSNIEKLVIGIIGIIVAIGCFKEDIKEVPAERSIEYNYADTTVSVDQGRSGTLLPVIDINKMVVTNHLLAGTFGYKHEQQVWNKDSIDVVEFTQSGYSPATVWGVRHNTYDVRIKYLNKSHGDHTARVYAPEGVKNFRPFGVNYATNVDLYLIIKREDRSMSYYDFDFKKVKYKYQYTVMGRTFLYRDYISSKVSNSNIFTF